MSITNLKADKNSSKVSRSVPFIELPILNFKLNMERHNDAISILSIFVDIIMLL